MICKNCGYKITDENNKFCPNCGEAIERIIETVEEPNTVCPNCNSVIDNPNSSFCSFCGASLAEEKDILCPNCNTVIEDENASFCHICGVKINDDITKQEATVQSIVKNAADKVRENEFVKSVKQDFENSQSLNILRDKANNVKAIKSLIVAIIMLTIVAYFVAINIRTCEECGKLYFGKEYTISWWGQTVSVCKDCYDDFYVWDW